VSAEIRPTEWLLVLPSVRTVVDAFRPVGLEGVGRDDESRVRGGTTLAVGTSVRSPGDIVEIQPAVAAFILDNRSLGKVPYEDQAILPEGDAGVSVHAMPRVALAVRPLPLLTLRAAAARGFRPPSFLELFGDRGRVVGNWRLAPESSAQFDASVRLQGAPHRWFRGSLEFGGFHTRMTDQIVFVQNSQKTSVPLNLGSARTSGIELAGGFLAFEHLDVAGAFTWTDSEILESTSEGHVGGRVPGLPKFELDVAASVDFPPWVRVGVAWRYTSGSFDSRSNIWEQAPRSLLNAHLRIQPGPRAPWFSLEVHNLTDNIVAPQQRDPTQSTDDGDRTVVPVTDYRGHPLPGRSFFVTIGWDIPTQTPESSGPNEKN
jgi:iron complex outermembrane receptor protein